MLCCGAQATAANREAACKALDALKTAGSTNAAAALKLAFELKSEVPPAASVPRFCVQGALFVSFILLFVCECRPSIS
jgi:hypothetical protein